MITKEGERKKGCNMSLSGTYQHFAETQTPERHKKHLNTSTMCRAACTCRISESTVSNDKRS